MGQIDQIAETRAVDIGSMLEAQAMHAVDRYAATGEPSLPDGHLINMIEAMRVVWRESALAYGREIIGQFKDGFSHLEIKSEESLFEQILQAYVDQYGAAAVRMINTTTLEQIKRMIAKGLKDGLGVDEIAKLMRERIPEFSQLRAHIIARTETHSASQFAGLGVAKSSKLSLVKVWNSTNDHRTRDFGEADGVADEFSHRAINGQVQALDSPFVVPMRNGGTENIMFPGDPNASAGNRIMCRCVMTYRLP